MFLQLFDVKNHAYGLRVKLCDSYSFHDAVTDAQVSFQVWLKDASGEIDVNSIRVLDAIAAEFRVFGQVDDYPRIALSR